MPTLTTNKKALYNYQVLEKYDAGIVLTGAEVKSAKGGHVILAGSYVSVRSNALWLLNCHISPYQMASNQHGYEPTRERKLLLKRKEISTLIGKLATKGLTVLPLSMYTKGGLVKIEIGVCRGKKQYDKRELIKKRDTDRSIQRLLRNKP